MKNELHANFRDKKKKKKPKTTTTIYRLAKITTY